MQRFSAHKLILQNHLQALSLEVLIHEVQHGATTQ